jgi:regulatory protein YycH of two-component signal transduction system YycFG
MKLSEKITRIGLIIMVLLSIYFSMSIWLSTSRKEPNIKEESQLTSTVNESTATDVFLPLNLIRIENGKTVVNNSENLISAVQHELKSASFGKLAEVVTKNAEQMKKYTKIEQGIELLYEGPFLISEYCSIYHLNIDLSDFEDTTDQYFTKIQVDFKQQKLRFIDTHQSNVYETAVKVDKEEIMTLLNKEGIQYNEMVLKQDAWATQYYLAQDLKLKKYSYILAAQPVTRFRNVFFTNTDDLHTNEESQDLSYTSGKESLFADEKVGTIRFKGNLTKENDGSIYSKSFDYIRRLGKSMGNLRYFDRSDNRVNYRTFIEGFPVFSNDLKGQVYITINQPTSNEPNVVIDSSVYTIQIPIPSEEEVTLESTEKLLEQLKAAGAQTDQIKSMVIGYTWQTIEEVKQVVDLSPEWYVLYGDTWYSAKDLISKLPNLEVK